MALAEKLLGDQFNQPDHTIVNHHTYAFLGDGCLMEGISHEACSLAGVLQLNKLIALYDDNGISIDGPVSGWFGDDTAGRFRAYGWNVIGPIDGHDVDAVSSAISLARTEQHRPNIILCRTTIGAGSPGRAGTAKAHGEPLGIEEIKAVREAIGWNHPPFEIPADIAARWDAHASGLRFETEWNVAFASYRAAYPALAAEFERRMTGDPLADTEATLKAMIAQFAAAGETLASRKSSQKALAEIAPILPELLGGSADLTGSNLTDFPGCGAVRGGQPGGRYVNYGVREFGMAAALNGIALHGGFIPYGGTFLTFSDYSRNAIRMAALMKIRVIHVFTHDSIGVGEDGPTHQPVEHAASLRVIPGLDVWRPCDGTETASAWAHAVSERHHPSALLLTRQNLIPQPRTPEQIAAIHRGGYVLQDRAGARAVILATGSEVGLATQAAALLEAQGCPVRVVSIPSSSIFDRQDRAYREEVLGHGLPRIGVEAGVTRWWGQYGCIDALGIDTFGESAPAPEVFKHFGLTAENLATRVAAAAGHGH
jgi:transketolase